MMLLKDPALRIQAQEVLHKEWMIDIETPDENGYLSQMDQTRVHTQEEVRSVRQTITASRNLTW